MRMVIYARSDEDVLQRRAASYHFPIQHAVVFLFTLRGALAQLCRGPGAHRALLWCSSAEEAHLDGCLSIRLIFYFRHPLPPSFFLATRSNPQFDTSNMAGTKVGNAVPIVKRLLCRLLFCHKTPSAKRCKNRTVIRIPVKPTVVPDQSRPDQLFVLVFEVSLSLVVSTSCLPWQAVGLWFFPWCPVWATARVWVFCNRALQNASRLTHRRAPPVLSGTVPARTLSC